MLNKIEGKNRKLNTTTGERERFSNMELVGKTSPEWNAESELPAAVVKLYDNRRSNAGHLMMNNGLEDTVEQLSSREDEDVEDALFQEARERWATQDSSRDKLTVRV